MNDQPLEVMLFDWFKKDQSLKEMIGSILGDFKAGNFPNEMLEAALWGIVAHICNEVGGEYLTIRAQAPAEQPALPPLQTIRGDIKTRALVADIAERLQSSVQRADAVWQLVDHVATITAQPEPLPFDVNYFTNSLVEAIVKATIKAQVIKGAEADLFAKLITQRVTEALGRADNTPTNYIGKVIASGGKTDEGAPGNAQPDPIKRLADLRRAEQSQSREVDVERFRGMSATLERLERLAQEVARDRTLDMMEFRSATSFMLYAMEAAMDHVDDQEAASGLELAAGMAERFMKRTDQTFKDES